jgi:hypothetical protein
MSGLPPYDDLPETVQAAFRGRTMLSIKELALVLEMHPKTLRRHIMNGDISGRVKGVGKVNQRWVFTIADVAKYLRQTQTFHARGAEAEAASFLAREGRRSVRIGRMNVTFPTRRARSPAKPKA